MATTTHHLHTYGKSCGWWAYRDVLAKFENFTTSGSLNGGASDGSVWQTGQLPAEWTEALKSDPSVSYVVYSYATPIAWYSELQCQWVIPDVKYSVTTSKHQGIISTAIGQIGQ